LIGGNVDSSSWIPLAAVKGKTELSTMRTVKNPHLSEIVSTSYVVKSARDWGQTQATFSADKLPAWAQAKVAKGPGSRRARDYLLRDGNVINLAFHTPGVGGASTDTFFVSDEGLAFRRVRSTREKPTLVRVKVDHPQQKAMIFAYGEIAGRFGWVPLAAIKTGKVGTDVDEKDSCDGKPDGVHCSELAPYSAYVCFGGQIASGFQCPNPGDVCTGPAPDGAGIACGPAPVP
jgi:hypothetical protein